MNGLFRRIRENENLDYLEESEDEEDDDESGDESEVLLLKVHASFLSNASAYESDGDLGYQTVPLADISQIVIYTFGGDDHVTLAGDIALPVIISSVPGAISSTMARSKRTTVWVSGR